MSAQRRRTYSPVTLSLTHQAYRTATARWRSAEPSALIEARGPCKPRPCCCPCRSAQRCPAAATLHDRKLHRNERQKVRARRSSRQAQDRAARPQRHHRPVGGRHRARINKDLGVFTYDPGFGVTAATESKITYIDGDAGVLLYRGYPDRAARREELASWRSPTCCCTASCRARSSSTSSPATSVITR